MPSDRAAYDAVLRDLREKRAEIDSAIKAIEALAPAHIIIGGKPLRRAPEPKQGVAPTIIDGAMLVLKREDRPVHVTELVRELALMGVKMESEDKENTVGSILNRRRRKKGDVARVGRGTWTLAGKTFDFVSADDEVDLGGDDDISMPTRWDLA